MDVPQYSYKLYCNIYNVDILSLLLFMQNDNYISRGSASGSAEIFSPVSFNINLNRINLVYNENYRFSVKAFSSSSVNLEPVSDMY